jgi:hypothetical protein
MITRGSVIFIVLIMISPFRFSWKRQGILSWQRLARLTIAVAIQSMPVARRPTRSLIERLRFFMRCEVVTVAVGSKGIVVASA